MTEKIEDVRSNDLDFAHEFNGGFAHVTIKDMDDGDVIVLTEDDIIRLHEFLDKVINSDSNPLASVPPWMKPKCPKS